MKFLVIASYTPSFIKFRGHLLSDIQSRGYEIHLASPELNKYPKEVSSLKALGYTVHEIPMQRTGTNPLIDAKTLMALYRLMKDIQPTYTLAYTIKPVIYGSLAAWMSKVPNRYALITGLGYMFQEAEKSRKQKTFQKIAHNLYRSALSTTDKVFFQNPDDLECFKSLNIISENKPTVVVNGSGVDISEYKVAPLVKKDDTQEVSFLLIARLLKDKGVREYIEAAKVIKPNYKDVRFNLVGWIDENPAAINQEELNSWINDGLIKYWGKLEDVKPAIADSSIFVLPSYREGTPRTVLEAMSMGRPIITTNAPGCRETVIEGVNGFLVSIKSVDELVHAMEKFINNPEIIATMGKKSRKIAEDKFDVHSVNKVMLKGMEID